MDAHLFSTPAIDSPFAALVYVRRRLPLPGRFPPIVATAAGAGREVTSE